MKKPLIKYSLKTFCMYGIIETNDMSLNSSGSQVVISLTTWWNTKSNFKYSVHFQS